MIICVRCGKHTEDSEGSLKHPYCKECFHLTWNSYAEYAEWLSTTHCMGVK